MRRFEAALLLPFFLTALTASGLWLRTECAHHRAASLVERILTGKPLGPDDPGSVLAEFSPPDRERLPGKHLFYESTLAVAAAGRADLPEALRLKWLGQARQALPEALARAPANTHAWTHLAYAAWLFEGPNRQTVDALRMSFYTSPAERQLLLWRLQLAGLSRDFWDSDFRDLLERQVLLAWRHAPVRLAQIAEAHHLLDLVGRVLASDPAALARFEKLAAGAVVKKRGK